MGDDVKVDDALIGYAIAWVGYPFLFFLHAFIPAREVAGYVCAKGSGEKVGHAPYISQ